jgi:hypothetical protein
MVSYTPEYQMRLYSKFKSLPRLERPARLDVLELQEYSANLVSCSFGHR